MEEWTHLTTESTKEIIGSECDLWEWEVWAYSAHMWGFPAHWAWGFLSQPPGCTALGAMTNTGQMWDTWPSAGGTLCSAYLPSQLSLGQETLLWVPPDNLEANFNPGVSSETCQLVITSHLPSALFTVTSPALMKYQESTCLSEWRWQNQLNIHYSISGVENEVRFGAYGFGEDYWQLTTSAFPVALVIGVITGLAVMALSFPTTLVWYLIVVLNLCALVSE